MRPGWAAGVRRICRHIIKLWDAFSGNLTQTIPFAPEKSSLFGVLSPDATILGTFGSDLAIQLWNVATGKLIRTVGGLKETPLSLAFSSDVAVLAVGMEHHTIGLCEVGTGQLISTID